MFARVGDEVELICGVFADGGEADGAEVDENLEDVGLAVADVLNRAEVDGLSFAIEETCHDALNDTLVCDDEFVVFENSDTNPAENETESNKGDSDNSNINPGSVMVCNGVDGVIYEEECVGDENEDDGEGFADPDSNYTNFVADYRNFDILIAGEFESWVVMA